MEGILIISHIVVFVTGICTGIYMASQVEEDIKKRTKK